MWPFTRANSESHKYIPLNSHNYDFQRLSRHKFGAFTEQRKPRANLKSAVQALSYVVVGIFPALLVYTLFVSETITIPRPVLINSPIPEMPKEVRRFEINMTFAGAPTPENDQAWNSLLPLGRGFVFIKDGPKYGFEPGIETPYGDIYSISMYHQLHCLGLVRHNYWRLVNGIISKNESISDEASHQLQNPHIGHCFDYFRQSFECAADMAVEWPRTDEDGSRLQVDGKGVPHSCVNKQAVREYIELHQFNESRNHDIAA